VKGTTYGSCSVSGTVTGQNFSGTNSPCNIVGSSGGSVFTVNPANPGGSVYPVTTLTQAAQMSATPGAAISTPYKSPTPQGSITVTPSPTSTPTNTPIITPSPTQTPQ
jgi:hypothetical protein